MNDFDIRSIEDHHRLLEERHALFERARLEAHRLRNEAIGEAVLVVAGLVRDATSRAAHSTRRLAARLRQHARQRGAVAAADPCVKRAA